MDTISAKKLKAFDVNEFTQKNIKLHTERKASHSFKSQIRWMPAGTGFHIFICIIDGVPHADNQVRRKQIQNTPEWERKSILSIQYWDWSVRLAHCIFGGSWVVFKGCDQGNLH